MGFYSNLYLDKSEYETSEMTNINEAKDCIPLFWILALNNSQEILDDESDTLSYKNKVANIKEQFNNIHKEIYPYFKYQDNANFLIELFNNILDNLNNEDSLLLECNEWQWMGYQDADSFKAMFKDLNYIKEQGLMEDLQYPNVNYIDEELTDVLVNDFVGDRIIMSLEKIIGLVDYNDYNISKSIDTLREQIKEQI